MIEIPQESFRLYFRNVRGVFEFKKVFQGDIICNETFILGFLKQAIEENLIWTMEHFDIFYKNEISYDFNTPTEEQISYAINNASQITIQKLSEPGVPFQVFYRPVGDNKWILMPENNAIVCDLNYITDLTQEGLTKGALSNLDRFDIYYKDSQELPPKVDIDSLIDAIRKEAGKV
ncbi:hypothetical protein SOV_36010 [Sporomusa ovata DSM 2662]|uniref:hypothetical protein n=1 Tax=Sporomusa ovata TaxID=2378 RepID=UPI0006D57428|nr:hypothetical protein [Sporomusa ovata]